MLSRVRFLTVCLACCVTGFASSLAAAPTEDSRFDEKDRRRRLELGRYLVNGVERVLYGERIDGFVHITDHPARGRGRCYFVERCLARDGHSSLQALVADYTRQARRLEEIPMLASVVKRIEQVELARYRFTGGERILYGQRVNGVVRVTDRPANGSGRSYLVDCGVERDGYSAFEALIADYTRQAGRLDEIPMAATHIRRVAETRRLPGIDEAPASKRLGSARGSGQAGAD